MEYITWESTAEVTMATVLGGRQTVPLEEVVLAKRSNWKPC